MTLEELLNQVSASGQRLAFLCQHKNGRWEVQLSCPEGFRVAYGDNCAEALSYALSARLIEWSWRIQAREASAHLADLREAIAKVPKRTVNFKLGF